MLRTCLEPGFPLLARPFSDRKLPAPAYRVSRPRRGTRTLHAVPVSARTLHAGYPYHPYQRPLAPSRFALSLSAADVHRDDSECVSIRGRLSSRLKGTSATQGDERCDTKRYGLKGTSDTRHKGGRVHARLRIMSRRPPPYRIRRPPPFPFWTCRSSDALPAPLLTNH